MNTHNLTLINEESIDFLHVKLTFRVTKPLIYHNEYRNKDVTIEENTIIDITILKVNKLFLTEQAIINNYLVCLKK